MKLCFGSATNVDNEHHSELAGGLDQLYMHRQKLGSVLMR